MTPLRGVQLLTGSVRLVVARTPSIAPGVLVNVNWSAPLVETWRFVSVVGTGVGTVMLTMLEVL